MSSDPLSASPSPADSADESIEQDLSAASVVKLRGRALLEALERHQKDASEHAEATGSYAFAAAVELGFTRAHAELVREAAKLHEVGEVYVPADILAKRHTQLSAEEESVLRSSPEAGGRLAHGAGVPEEVCTWIERAGERYDGAGPGGLRGEKIPLESRVIRAACACDRALAWLPAAGRMGDRGQAAAAVLHSDAGSQLDPRVVEALTSVLLRAATAAAAAS